VNTFTASTTATRDNGSVEVTVIFTLQSDQPVPSQWDADNAAREIVSAYRTAYGLESARVASIERVAGPVTLSAAEYAALLAAAQGNTSTEPSGA
jgi:hypothetical protein